MIKWDIKTIDIDKLKPLSNNPRKIKQEDLKKLQKDIENVGFFKPIIVDTDFVILGGNQRYLIRKSQGAKEIQVSIPSQQLTRKQRKEIIILDNKHRGEFDMDILEADFSEILNGMDFEDLKIKEEPEIEEDNFEEKEIDKYNVKIGDIYQLGKHQLMCGNSTKKENIDKLMKGEKADMVFTDPPYGMNLDTDFSKMKGKIGEKRKKGNKYKKIIGDKNDFSEDLILTIFKNFNYCKEIFIWGADYYIELLKGFKDGNLIVWDKRTNEQMGKIFGSEFELCWSKKRHKKGIIRVKWAGVYGTETQDIKKRIHPTQKPIQVSTFFIDKYSKVDNIIVDLYGGSGSTLIACEQTNRKCYMMELDEHYCSVILERWEALTGEEVKKLK